MKSGGFFVRPRPFLFRRLKTARGKTAGIPSVELQAGSFGGITSGRDAPVAAPPRMLKYVKM